MPGEEKMLIKRFKKYFLRSKKLLGSSQTFLYLFTNIAFTILKRNTYIFLAYHKIRKGAKLLWVENSRVRGEKGILLMFFLSF